MRYGYFLEDVETSSLFLADLGGRGAIWSFLRYIVDHDGRSDADFFHALANATTSGIQNLGGVAGGDVFGLARDWAVSIYADDLVAGVAEVYSQPSWNHRSVLPALALFDDFPLAARSLVSGGSADVSLKGGGAAFLRLDVAASTRATLNTTSDGAPPPSGLRLSVLRVR